MLRSFFVGLIAAVIAFASPADAAVKKAPKSLHVAQLSLTGAGGSPKAAGGGGGGPVAFDAVFTGNVVGAGSPITPFVHTPVGTPSKAVVAVSACCISGTPTVTYGAVSCTSANTATSPSGEFVWLFGCPSPPSGPQTVTVAFSGSPVWAMAFSYTFTGGSATVFNATGNSTGTSQTPSSTCASATNNLVVDVINFDNGSVVAFTPTGTNTSQDNNSASSVLGYTSTAPGAASVAMGWSTAGTAAAWAAVCGSMG